MRHQDLDSPWKELIERFLQLTLPHLHDLIDWKHKPQFLDKELQRLLPKSHIGRQVVDKLIRVVLKDGNEQWILLHLEVQAQPEAEFERRMFAYYARIWLDKQTPVVSVAVLADDNPSWRPSGYRQEVAGCWVEFRFLGVKLLDMDEGELARSRNPVALLLRAHRAALRLRDSPELLLAEKMRLTREIEGLGYNRDVGYQLFRLLDWLVQLPEGYEARYEDFLVELEEAGKMPYLTTPERYALKRGIEQGLEQGIQQGLQAGMRRAILRVLQARFGSVPPTLEERLEQIQSEETLQELCGLAAQVESVSAFEQALQ